MKILLMINTMLNMMFLMTKHPLSMGLTIILQTTAVSMMTGMMMKSFWFSYILFLMYIGGMMVMFIYMTSLIPNMMFKMSKKTMMMTMSILLIMSSLSNPIWEMINSDLNQINEKTMMLTKMYSAPTNMTTTLLALYLMYTMISVYNITELKMGTLRMMFN